jgi:hypothetical protein
VNFKVGIYIAIKLQYAIAKTLSCSFCFYSL